MEVKEKNGGIEKEDDGSGILFETSIVSQPVRGNWSCFALGRTEG